jgi:hypothetical protein
LTRGIDHLRENQCSTSSREIRWIVGRPCGHE